MVFPCLLLSNGSIFFSSVLYLSLEILFFCAVLSLTLSLSCEVKCKLVDWSSLGWYFVGLSLFLLRVDDPAIAAVVVVVVVVGVDTSGEK